MSNENSINLEIRMGQGVMEERRRCMNNQSSILSSRSGTRVKINKKSLPHIMKLEDE